MVATIFGSIAVLLPGLVCGGAMAVCMWMMFRGGRAGRGSDTKADWHDGSAAPGSPDRPGQDQSSALREPRA